jgi:4-hydroxybenzoate polyprenyltransferase
MKLYYFVKLSRPLNLIIIALTMILLRYYIVVPFLGRNGIDAVISPLDFFLLILSTLLIAAAGNIINDYFDIRPDRVNKRRKVIVGKYIERREAMIAHIVLSSAGLIMAGFVAHKYRIDWILVFQIMAILLLWLYSASFKKSFVVGNLMVAFLTANIPLMVIGFDIPAILKSQGLSFPFIQADPGPMLKVVYFTLGYAGFAFLLNLIREIIKDIGDMRGDLEISAKTMPIVLGTTTTKRFVTGIILFTIVGLMYLQQTFLPDLISSIYLLFVVILPLIVGAIRLKSARKSRHFVKVSNWIKWSMAGGLGYLPLFYYVVLNNHTL